MMLHFLTLKGGMMLQEETQYREGKPNWLQ